jgi:peptidoglycan endopeptidase LytF/peptidoglycan endopeptidase LytE
MIYTVVSGDNLSRIAKRYGVKISQIREWNNLSSDSLKIGQKLRLRQDAAAVPAAKKAAAAKPAPAPAPVVNEPAPAAPAEPAAPAVTEPAAVVEQAEDVAAPVETAPAEEVKPVNVMGYSVGEGDTLEHIARIYETTVEAIMEYNPAVKSNADLQSGMELKIPFN